MLSVAEVCPSLREMDSSTAKEDPAAGSNPAARQLMEQAWAKVEGNYDVSCAVVFWEQRQQSRQRRKKEGTMTRCWRGGDARCGGVSTGRDYCSGGGSAE